MFSFDNWMAYIDLSVVLKYDINTVNKPKHTYDISKLKAECLQFLDRYSEFHKIYTDGSKENDHIGAAFYDADTGDFMKFRITDNVPIMQVELIAISEALAYVESLDRLNNRIVIFTDSKSSIQHLARCTSTFRGRPIAYDIIKSILKLASQQKEVIIQWIPSHIGIEGNEIVDCLAKEGSSDGVEFRATPYHTDHIPIVKRTCFQYWSEYFDRRSREKGIWYRTIQPQPIAVPWIDKSTLCRQDLTLLLRLRSGHMPLNKFAYLMRKSTSPKCDVCNDDEDAYHILTRCVRNEVLRNKLGGNINLSDPLSDNNVAVLNIVKMALNARNNVVPT